jgi:hypothetical protein
MLSRRQLCVLTAMVLGDSTCSGQTTQGIISGRMLDSVTGNPVPSAQIFYANSSSEVELSALTNDLGYYGLPLLSPGTYRIRATASGYQTQETYELELHVASRIELDFWLRPLTDVWEAGQYRSVFLPGSKAVVSFFGPDVDATYSLSVDPPPGADGRLDSTLSYVIDPEQLSNLPLSGRNVYDLLLFQPGVTAGLSVNGQRPSSGLFLLDGLNGNTSFGPEFVQEYRVSTNNFSAEFGRATGFLANAITKSGSRSFHGLGYGYLDNEILDANAFQSNKNGFPRQEHRELHAGVWASGPIVANRSLFFVGYEDYRTRTKEYPFTFRVPVLESFEDCSASSGSRALALLERFRPPVVPAQGTPGCNSLSAPYSVSIPIAINRGFGIARVDNLFRNGKDRFMVRAVTNRETDPYAIPSLYPAFTSAANTGNYSFGADYVAALTPSATAEIRLGWLRSTYSLPRPDPEVPTLITGADAGRLFPQGISLPGLSDSIGDDRSRTDEVELGENMILVRGRQVVKLGGGAYFDRNSNYAGFPSATYQFADLQSFAEDRAQSVTVLLSRQSVLAGGPLEPPIYGNSYKRNEFYGFVQDSIRASPRLGFDFGVRYDAFGAPATAVTPDAYIGLGPGSSTQERLRGAALVFDGSCCRSSFRPDRTDWAGRLGVSYDLTGAGKHVFRAAYGVFYDPQPGFSTTANNQEVVGFVSPTGTLTPNYMQLHLDMLSGLIKIPITNDPQLVLINNSLRAPQVQSWFAGFQEFLSNNFSLEISHTGAVGGRLITGDTVNRPDASGTDESRLNPNLPNISYFSNSGYSQYTALTTVARYHSRSLLLQAAYTWGHSIDNESSPLGIFTRQFDNRLDRGDSDYDERQNLVLYSLWQVPVVGKRGWQRAAFAGWQVATLMGFRSGFPYSLLASIFPPCGGSTAASKAPILMTNRPNLVGGISPFLPRPVPVPGGVRMLDPAAFCDPGVDTPGNMGRNSLRGPGFRNIDASIAKSFQASWLGDSGRIQFRADLFNAFNHANLGNPQIATTGFGTFGQAFYGIGAAPPVSVSVVPLDETPRRIELQLRIYF